MSTKIVGPVRYAEDGRQYRITAAYGMDEQFAARNGQAPHFSLTCSVERRAGPHWVHEGGGCAHDRIARFFPDLGPSVARWHLVSTEGPLHYVANARYWWEKMNGTSTWPAEPGDPDPAEAFRHTVVFGVLADDAMPPSSEPWERVEAWLAARLPRLMEAFRAEMDRLGVGPAVPCDATR